MKKLLVVGVIIFSLLGVKADAQIRLGVNINLGSQPQWGPSGYERADYYYLPDVDAYYNVPQKQFIYMEGNNWVFRSSLPGRYSNYDLYNGYKVVVNEPKPYLRANYYRSNYGKYRNWHGQRQVAIRDHHDNGNHNGQKNDRDNDHGKGRGRGNGNGHGNGHGRGNN